MVELLLLPAVLPLVALLPRRRRLRRRRKRVSFAFIGDTSQAEELSLILFVEKEESDEDMGFGLFD